MPVRQPQESFLIAFKRELLREHVVIDRDRMIAMAAEAMGDALALHDVDIAGMPGVADAVAGPGLAALDDEPFVVDRARACS
jgi:hypothetical protein